MTQNQIAYLNAIENRVHNRNVEAETAKHNQELRDETRRSNLAREAETNRYNTLSLAETQRANLAREQYNLLQLQELQRSNLESEAIRRQSNQISQYRNENDYLLGIGSLFENSRINTSNIARNESEVKRLNAVTTNVATDTTLKHEQAKKTRAETVLIGAKTSTENTLRNPQKSKIIGDTFGIGVGQILKGRSRIVSTLFGI